MRRVLDPFLDLFPLKNFKIYCLKIICLSPPLPPVFIGLRWVSSPLSLSPFSVVHSGDAPLSCLLPAMGLQAEPGQGTLVFRFLIFSQ